MQQYSGHRVTCAVSGCPCVATIEGVSAADAKRFFETAGFRLVREGPHRGKVFCRACRRTLRLLDEDEVNEPWRMDS
jgi:hypothetical protein